MKLSFSSVHRLVALSIALAACGSPPEAAHPQPTTDAPAPSARGAASRDLHALFDEAWEHDMKEWPTWASDLGDHRYDDRWEDPSPAATLRRQAYDRDVLARAKRIDFAKLTKEDALSYDVFVRKYEVEVEGQKFQTHLFVLDQRGGIQTADDLADAITFDSPKAYADWNARLRAFGTYMKQTLEVLAEGAKKGIVHPRVVMDRLPAQIDKQIVDDPGKSPFYAPYKKPMPIPAADAARLQEEAKRAIAQVVVPAFKEMRAFFTQTYLPACQADVGAWRLPDGDARYAYWVRYHTTTNLTPNDVHELGLREVARIKSEMEGVKAKTGFSGSMKEFFAFLRTDPRFFEKSRETLLARYRETAKKVDPELVKLFGKLPRTPYGVSPIPDNTAPDTTTAYYREPAADGSRAGTYFVNLYKPETRPTWEMPALTLHESVPGHHLQIAISNEQTSLPNFRRHGSFTAFVEGWGLYAESLGDEIGMYDDPYAKFGQLTYEMWRAVRLVIDTGIHAKKWSRKQAIDFFMENAPKQELDITNEVDRYIAWPGQALAYKIGELKIKELRKKQREKLGDKWNEKAFHDAVLENGALPLDVLEREILGTPGK